MLEGLYTRRPGLGTSGGALVGTVTNSGQPAFLAYNAADVTNQTGNGATVTVPFGTEVYDQAGNFASNTFTAPVTGRYRLCVTVQLETLASVTLFFLRLVTSNRNYDQQWANPPNGKQSLSLVTDVDMDAGDTASVQTQATGMAGNTLSIKGSATMVTRFSGELVA